MMAKYSAREASFCSSEKSVFIEGQWAFLIWLPQCCDSRPTVEHRYNRTRI